MRRLLITAASVLSLMAASCSDSPTGAGPADPTGGSADAEVAQIRSINDLQSAFNDDAGDIRIVLSMSPT